MNRSYVGKPCPKCAHVRAATDNGPDWQCPKCGISYEKFRNAQLASEGGAADYRTGDEAVPGRAGQPYTQAKFLIHLAIALALLYPFLVFVVHVPVKSIFWHFGLMAFGGWCIWDGLKMIKRQEGTVVIDVERTPQIEEYRVTGFAAVVFGMIEVCFGVVCIICAIAILFDKHPF